MKMKVLILGIDGFLGWSLAKYLSVEDYEVWGCDNFNRRTWVKAVGSNSVFPLISMEDRVDGLEAVYGKSVNFVRGI